ncbi:MAG TPA: ATP-dependent DNA helicase RecG, partial [Sphingomonas sp.]
MRPEILNPLFAETEALKGVGAGLARPLAKLGLTRVIDLLFHLPTGMIERRRVDRLDMADAGRGVIATLMAVSYKSGSSPRGPTRVQATDEGGNPVSLVYFGGGSGWARKQHPLGEPRIVAGRLDLYGQELQIVHPDQVVTLAEAAEVVEREPVYPLSAGITSRRLASFVEQALERIPPLPEWIEPSLLAQRGWPPFAEALRRAHADPGDALVRDRLAYDEVFANQLALMLVRGATRRRRGRALVGTGRLRDRLDLPYTPTGAQSRAIAEIEGDMRQETPMLRLLQGDVGAGKTLVATRALITAIEAGAQGALLAPTEILARQHYETLGRQLAGLGISIAILTGRDKGRARESTLMGLADGSIDLLIGTHAIFQDSVAYKALGLVVVDEQHRFGVAQRLMLAAKGAHPPHMLVMTATPIPRTLTLAQYGEMDVSRLDEMPPGRQPIETRVVSLERIDEVVAGLGRHVAAGGQAYWVCPLVEETGEDDAAAEARAAALKLAFGAERVGLVHGRMKAPEKDAAMAAFQQGRLGVLVAT